MFFRDTIGLSFYSCKRNDLNKDYPFEAEVLGRNSDCGLFAIKFSDKLDKVREIADTYVLEDIYIAKNLPIELQTAGLIIILNIRKPIGSE